MAILLKTRQEILESRKIIASQIAGFQQSFFDEEVLQSYIDDNEEAVYWELFDAVKGAATDIDTHLKILGLQHTDITTFTPVLAGALRSIFDYIGASEITVISHLKMNLFGDGGNDFSFLRNSHQKLEALIGTPAYKEALVLSLPDLAEFIDILFWMERSDPTKPEYIFLFDQDERIQLNICKYGNLHMTELGKEHIPLQQLERFGWQLIQGPEFDNFSDDFRIEGRSISI